MSYKTILVPVDLSVRAEAIIRCAAHLAVAENAHLVGLASTGINPLIYQCNAAAPGIPLPLEDLSGLTGEATRALERFESVARAEGALSLERRLTDDDHTDSVILQSRYCDLLVTGQDDPARAASLPAAPLPQQLVLHCPRPVLVIPHSGHVGRIGERVLVAWDGGLAASRAIGAAMPLLRRARLVTLAVFDPGWSYAAHGEEPGADMALYLARHDVRVEVQVRDAAGDVGEALLSLARDAGADLLVMGCYGHARFRELLLGGATRTILRCMTLPVLMHN